MQDACCSADCFQFVIRNLKNPQTALWVPGIQQNELQLLGTGIREFLTTSIITGMQIARVSYASFQNEAFWP